MRARCALPLWFIEGMAEYLSLGPVDPEHRDVDARGGAGASSCRTIDKLDNPRYFPYRYGQALWAYIAGRYGDGAVGDCSEPPPGGDATYDSCEKAVCGIDTKQLSQQWHNAAFEAFRPDCRGDEDAGVVRAAPLIIREKQRRDLNVGPELSPDGVASIYFSERDLFSIDLYPRRRAHAARSSAKITNTAHRPALREPVVHQLGRRLGLRPAGGSSSRASARASRC